MPTVLNRFEFEIKDRGRGGRLQEGVGERPCSALYKSMKPGLWNGMGRTPRLRRRRLSQLPGATETHSWLPKLPLRLGPAIEERL
jgi:hypothetical protein